MTLNDQEKKKLIIEKQIEENNTRESSILVISTVASTVALGIIATLTKDTLEVKEQWGSVVFLFVILSFLYRELTIHFSEIPTYRVLNKELHIDSELQIEQITHDFVTFTRMVIMRLFLLLPLVAYSVIYNFSMFIPSLYFAFAISSILSIIELIKRINS